MIRRLFATLNESHRPLNADCCEVDHAGQGGDHLYVADDLADGGGLKQSESELQVYSGVIPDTRRSPPVSRCPGEGRAAGTGGQPPRGRPGTERCCYLCDSGV